MIQYLKLYGISKRSAPRGCGGKMIKNGARGAAGSIVSGSWVDFDGIGKFMIFRR